MRSPEDPRDAGVLRQLPADLFSEPGAAGARLPDGVGTDTLLGWLQKTLDVLRSPDFFLRAASGISHLAEMDAAAVLMREGGKWVPKAVAPAATTIEPSKRVLNQVLAGAKTVWKNPPPADGVNSLFGVHAVVAAPILGPGREVAGVLYGERRSPRDGLPPRIDEVQALFVELLASGVAAGLTRVKHELAVRRFEQYFTPELARRLIDNEELLNPAEKEVSVLFCDIQGFSRISQQIGHHETIRWIGDVLGSLSECVMEEDGVVVDFIGDALMAMWGAPDEQADHRDRACRAALAMLDRLGSLNGRWEAVLGEPTRLAIGVNSGLAQVGNTGSPQKFKYGPLGNTVNLASRIQGVVRKLRTEVLVSDATFAGLAADVRALCRRLCQVTVVNITGAVTLYELKRRHARSDEVGSGYAAALSHFEQKRFLDAVQGLAQLAKPPLEDGPSLALLTRAASGVSDGAEASHPVWNLDSK
jgi:adenylate cyclase